MSAQFHQDGNVILTESDKQKHFTAGMVVSAVGYQWGLRKFESKKKATFFAVGLGLAAGIAKESFDSFRPGNYFDERDLLATVMGSVSITIPLNLLMKPKKKYQH